MNKKFPIKADDWNRYLDGIFELISNDEEPLYESKMNAYLEETVVKYLHPSDDYVSLTDIARKYDAANPSYLIQSWLRSRNTVEFLANGKESIIRILMRMLFKEYQSMPKLRSLP